LILVIRDITGLKQAAEAQAKLEEQLRQAQKMESIGRLAGGVAHDFNNLLTVIDGYADMMQEKLVQSDPLYEDLSQIRRASERAARLTRQLLAFSRKQILAPTTLDLNSLVTNMHQMLERVIGEDILLRIDLQPGLWPVLADPNQLEQVILNLVVNARDAMPAGGSLTIETRNIFVNGRDEGLVVDSQFSACVRLSVIDTGEGMDAETRARAFDPFFTTKPPGYGTGLGLSTVYGIIKQSNGDITVASEPGVGATFRIYLPPGVMSPESLSVPETLPIFGYGNETILVVEDQPMVLDLVRVALHSHGYTILEAGNGSAALELASNHLGPIELLVTDIVMPQMGGLELAERLKELRPQIKVLFMSGYSDDAVERPRMLGEDVAFLPKPFSPSTLAAKVYQLLARSEA
jgi:nitrogen-specific signal transduction histidine kinase